MNTSDRGPDTVYASPETRDAFLRALDTGDRALSIALAGRLVTCINPLPGMTREALGLPPGATYGAAARSVLSSSRPPAERAAAVQPVADE